MYHNPARLIPENIWFIILSSDFQITSQKHQKLSRPAPSFSGAGSFPRCLSSACLDFKPSPCGRGTKGEGLATSSGHFIGVIASAARQSHNCLSRHRSSVVWPRP